MALAYARVHRPRHAHAHTAGASCGREGDSHRRCQGLSPVSRGTFPNRDAGSSAMLTCLALQQLKADTRVKGGAPGDRLHIQAGNAYHWNTYASILEAGALAHLEGRIPGEREGEFLDVQAPGSVRRTHDDPSWKGEQKQRWTVVARIGAESRDVMQFRRQSLSCRRCRVARRASSSSRSSLLPFRCGSGCSPMVASEWPLSQPSQLAM